MVLIIKKDIGVPANGNWALTTELSKAINIENTSEQLSKAQEFVKNLLKDGKTILFVGSKPESKNIMK